MANDRTALNADGFDEGPHKDTTLWSRKMPAIRCRVRSAEARHVQSIDTQLPGQRGNGAEPRGPCIDCLRRAVKQENRRPLSRHEVARADTGDFYELGVCGQAHSATK